MMFLARQRGGHHPHRLAHPQVRQFALGQVDARNNRVEVHQIEQVLVHVHQVALFHQPQRDSAGDGGHHPGVVELPLRVLERQLQLPQLELAVGMNLFADQPLRVQCLQAREFPPRPLHISSRLFHLRRLDVILELHQHLARLDPIPLLDQQLGHPVRRAREHPHLLFRLEVPRSLLHRLDGPAPDGRHLHRHRHHGCVRRRVVCRLAKRPFRAAASGQPHHRHPRCQPANPRFQV
ncbi:MAG: hypothetical protein M5U12_11795 [Verrucomicrobia bacterium]|nr:hypothetical protein [Verrucomicrobiota bacterium]